MATALIAGLVRKGFVTSSSLKVIDIHPEARARLAQEFQVTCFEAATDESLECDVLVLALKPQHMRRALADVSGRLDHQLVISVAAGLRLPDLSRWLGAHKRLVRAMPNSPALIGCGISGLYADRALSEAERRTAEEILGAVGGTLWVNDESLMDTVTAVSGSGPAYVFYFVDALRAAALELGLDSKQATRLSLDTFVGALALATQSGEDISLLRDRVVSKGGTTEAALDTMEHDGIRGGIVRAVRAACARGRELGQLLGEE